MNNLFLTVLIAAPMFVCFAVITKRLYKRKVKNKYIKNSDLKERIENQKKLQRLLAKSKRIRESSAKRKLKKR